MITRPTDHENELLVHLNEESSEVTQEACKIQRYGFDSAHPDEPQLCNALRLEREIADFLATVRLLDRSGQISYQRIEALVPERMAKKMRFLTFPLKELP